MSTSVRRAEEVALNGEGEDVDTQACLDIQEHFLSSSPKIPEHYAYALKNNSHSGSSNLATATVDDVKTAVIASASHVASPTNASQDSATVNASVATSNDKVPTLGLNSEHTLPTLAIEDDSTVRRKSIQVRRNTEGQLRALDSEGSERHILGFDEKQRRQVQQEMDDYSPKSSVSATQPNDEKVYQVYNLQRVRDQAVWTQDGAAEDDKRTPKARESALTDSTAFTYAEDDTGHVKLDFLTAPENQEAKDDDPSQDPSGHQAQEPSQVMFEPRTPAPINPFSQKGSVMKGHEMFGATQPSSFARLASPTSSRPSPDVYNTSPPQKRMDTSPLERHEPSILQSNVRTLLRSTSLEALQNADITPTASSRSFDTRRREPKGIYVSTKESQERRRKTSNNSDSEPDTDPDDEAIKRRRKQELETRVNRDLAQVTSSRSYSGKSRDVEVPASGGRRRSVEEDYVAQCEGIDARDTQQDDIIIDSQAVDEEPEAFSHLSASVRRSASQASTASVDSPPLFPGLGPSAEIYRVPELTLNSQTNPSSPKDLSLSVQPGLPLQEVSTNRHDLKTPACSKASRILSDGVDATIPHTILETSPLGEAWIRPMGQVTSLSFTDNIDDDALVNDAPGFTQDMDFDNVIDPPSPTPSPKAPVRAFPLFETSSENETRFSGTRSSAAAVCEHSARVDETILLDEALSPGKDTKIQVDSVTQDASQIEPIQAAEGSVEEGSATEAQGNGLSTDQMQSSAILLQPITKAQEETREPVAKRELRSKEELKGPSRALRRPTGTATPKASAQVSSLAGISTLVNNSAGSSKRVSDTSSISSTPLSSLGPTPSSGTRSSARNKRLANSQLHNVTPVPAPKPRKIQAPARLAKEETPAPSPQRGSRRLALQSRDIGDQTSASAHLARSSKRKYTAGDVDVRTSKRQSLATRESSDDPLAYPESTSYGLSRPRKSGSLFSKMAFAVSYVKNEKEKARVTDLITEQSGRILDAGFDKLFEISNRSRGSDEAADLALTVVAKSAGFVALIADEHSRKAKYMQALALGLPCISGRWILACIAKGEVIDWAPYLLCAGHSTVLGNAIRSRTLTPYSAIFARFSEILSCREKPLNGRSVLVVTAKGKEDTRKAYVFLARALGPSRLIQVPDNEQARKKLLEDDTWDLLYVDKNELSTEAAVFGSGATNSGSKKRKWGSGIVKGVASPAPKRIRIINDEDIVQSLILGQLVEG